ncbi:hypothetical protein GTA21_20140 [Roseobacter sp. HKCCD7106]|uniref:hypothetical protein n=1 Tax=Roseobacter sp. HKCCD7106 TaxID=2690659 RepID=UPI001555B378|nr:hypothetical protein [Roseobacter sp. HKCCD7106]NPT83432.1 hypothetical protein [Roseobacter sp. HKCCD7106]
MDNLPEFAMQKAPIISALNSVFCLRLELSGRIIGASAHRRIGASAHRRIGASAHRRIGASAGALTGSFILTV